MDGLNNFSRLYDIGVVSTCPVLGPGNIGLVCESELKEVGGDMGFALVGLHIKGSLTGESFASLGIS